MFEIEREKLFPPRFFGYTFSGQWQKGARERNLKEVVSYELVPYQRHPRAPSTEYEEKIRSILISLIEFSALTGLTLRAANAQTFGNSRRMVATTSPKASLILVKRICSTPWMLENSVTPFSRIMTAR